MDAREMGGPSPASRALESGLAASAGVLAEDVEHAADETVVLLFDLLDFALVEPHPFAVEALVDGHTAEFDLG